MMIRLVDYKQVVTSMVVFNETPGRCVVTLKAIHLLSVSSTRLVSSTFILRFNQVSRLRRKSKEQINI